jgi:uncharacterized protein (TIGR02147 family)
MKSEVSPSEAHLARTSRSPVSGKRVFTAPSIYDFTNYREFLQAFFNAKKAANSSYSASAFARKAGLGENSRGYLKLVIDGKRNLSPHTIRAFAEAIGLGLTDSVYFESLVHFNQAERPNDRKYYFERLQASQPAQKSSHFELLESQYRYFSHWYVIAVRELIATTKFDEDPSAIAKALKGRITSKEAAQALADLKRLDLIECDESGKWVQTTPIITFKPGVFSPFIQNFHLGMMEQARHALLEDDYAERNASGVTLSCSREKVPELKKAIDDFRVMITEKFGITDVPADSVIQVNVQLFQLTKGERK